MEASRTVGHSWRARNSPVPTADTGRNVCLHLLLPPSETSNLWSQTWKLKTENLKMTSNKGAASSLFTRGYALGTCRHRSFDVRMNLISHLRVEGIGTNQQGNWWAELSGEERECRNGTDLEVAVASWPQLKPGEGCSRGHGGDSRSPAVARCPVPVQFRPAAVGEAAELREKSEKLEP
jgi:hypothetical protein